MKEEITAAPAIIEATTSEIDHFGFAPDESVKPIIFSMLRNSIRVEGKYGKTLSTRPIQSWELMTLVMQLMDEHGLNYSQDIIYAQKKNSHIMINEQEKIQGFTKELCPANRWLFDKLLTKWTIPHIGLDLMKGAIAMAFHDDGIDLAFGLHVDVCSNFNIMGGNILRTYAYNGRPGDTFDYIRLKLKDWLQNFDQMIKIETGIMKAMKEFPINSPEIIQKVIGQLYIKAIQQAYGSKILAPFDTHGVSSMVQNYISTRNPAVINSAWDLYNWGTNIMKPGIVDLSDITNSSDMFCNFVLNDIMGVDREGFTKSIIVP